MGTQRHIMVALVLLSIITSLVTVTYQRIPDLNILAHAVHGATLRWKTRMWKPDLQRVSSFTAGPSSAAANCPDSDAEVEEALAGGRQRLCGHVQAGCGSWMGDIDRDIRRDGSRLEARSQ